VDVPHQRVVGARAGRPPPTRWWCPCVSGRPDPELADVLIASIARPRLEARLAGIEEGVPPLGEGRSRHAQLPRDDIKVLPAEETENGFTLALGDLALSWALLTSVGLLNMLTAVQRNSGAPHKKRSPIACSGSSLMQNAHVTLDGPASMTYRQAALGVILATTASWGGQSWFCGESYG
jgi:hypothetical protein